MKTTKFRAWHKTEKIMCPINVLTDKGAFLIGVKNGADILMDGGKQIIIAPKEGRFCLNDEFELMQFWFKDKNKVEVFENDIVEMRSELVINENAFDSTYTGRIVILPSLGVCIRNPKIFNHITGEISTYYGYKTIAAYRSVKIGNCFENPELL